MMYQRVSNMLSKMYLVLIHSYFYLDDIRDNGRTAANIFHDVLSKYFVKVAFVRSQTNAGV